MECPIKVPRTESRPARTCYEEDAPSLPRIIEVFSEAMMAGWVGGVKASPVAGEPNTKETIFTRGHYTVRDKYHVSKTTDFSSGQTRVLFYDVPVWVMHYGGRYPKEVIPFLKDMLRAEYIVKEFRARGPADVTSLLAPMRYSNDFRPMFVGAGGCEHARYFEGLEEIHETNLLRNRLGWHTYFGMALF